MDLNTIRVQKFNNGRFLAQVVVNSGEKDKPYKLLTESGESKREAIKNLKKLTK